MAKHNQIGKLGEELAILFLKKRGFIVLEQNYLRNSGEIDVLAKKGSKTHFVEVKTVSCENLSQVSRENLRPEENVTREKQRKLKNVISIYIAQKGIKEWSFDVCAVFVDVTNKASKIRYLEDLILVE
jgi:putative endonuclease